MRWLLVLLGCLVAPAAQAQGFVSHDLTGFVDPIRVAIGSNAAVQATPLDLNAATVEQLDGLPGVGPVTAQRIVDWRTRNGRFATVDQLREVEGIGERRLGQLRELVRT